METWKLWLEIKVERWKGYAHRDKSKQTWTKYEGSDNLSESEHWVRDRYTKIACGVVER